MFKNSRRYIAVLAVFAALSANGQTVFSDGEFRPYDDIAPAEDPLTDSVRDRILYFVHFTCPYCRQAHDYLRRWGDQLPVPYALEVVPAVALPEHMPMAVAYYAVLQAKPERLEEFEALLFRELQDTGRSSHRPFVFRNAARQIGIRPEVFTALTQNEHTKRFVQRANALTRRYEIQEVPTVVVASRFLTGPGRVQNDQRSFVTILNGLVSMDVRERQQ